jgi:hypothetical protein
MNIEQGAQNVKGSFLAFATSSQVSSRASNDINGMRSRCGCITSLPRSSKISLLCLFLLLGVHFVYLVSLLSGNKIFAGIMKGVFSIIFGTITLIFIPLFFIMMRRLKLAYEDFYDQIIATVVVVFCGYESIIIFRYICYLNLQWKSFHFLNPQGTHAEIPFYISELIVAVFYIYGLNRVYNNTEKNEEIESTHTDEDLLLPE